MAVESQRNLGKSHLSANYMVQKCKVVTGEVAAKSIARHTFRYCVTHGSLNAMRMPVEAQGQLEGSCQEACAQTGRKRGRLAMMSMCADPRWCVCRGKRECVRGGSREGGDEKCAAG